MKFKAFLIEVAKLLLRGLRVVTGQAIGLAVTTYGNIQIPFLNIGLGAFVNMVFKAARDKYPNSKIWEWLPL